jgi:hypothetical protein
VIDAKTHRIEFRWHRKLAPGDTNAMLSRITHPYTPLHFLAKELPILTETSSWFNNEAELTRVFPLMRAARRREPHLPAAQQ